MHKISTYLKQAENYKNKDLTYRYQLLGRLQQDCDHYLGSGNKKSRLWAGNVKDQIQEMKDIWKSFKPGEQPKWLPWKKILDYEKKM